MIVLTADDFALSEEIDAAVVDLAARGRLSATSAMTNQPRWPAAAGALAKLRDRLALGLHLTLTEGRPLSPGTGHALGCEADALPPLSRLLRQAVAGRIAPAVIAAEARAQITAFADAIGRMPDMIDGHQHAHVLPGVRDGLLDAIASFDWPAPPLVRTPANRAGLPRDGLAAVPKRGLVGLLTTGFRKRLAAAGLPTNDTFAGFSTFRPGPAVTAELARALGPASPGVHLVMTHPAAPVSREGPGTDPLAARRADEYRALLELPDLPALIWHPQRAACRIVAWPGRAP